MTKLKEVQAAPNAVAKWDNEGGASSRRKSDQATSWFVPPLVVPALLIALIAARVVYQAYF